MSPTVTLSLLQRFCVAFPNNRDYYVALGFFRATGLSEAEVHTLADAVSQLSVCQEDL